MSASYRHALELARKDYAEALARRDAINAEIEAIEKEQRQLRFLIESLANLIGEPSGLPPKPEGRALTKARPQPPAPPQTNGAGQTNEDRVLQLLANGPLNPKAIREKTGIKEWTLIDLLARLRQAKKVTRTGNGPRDTKYQLA